MNTVEQYIVENKLASYGPVINVEFSDSCKESYPCRHRYMRIEFAEYNHECSFHDGRMFANVLTKLGAVVPDHFTGYLKSKDLPELNLVSQDSTNRIAMSQIVTFTEDTIMFHLNVADSPDESERMTVDKYIAKYNLRSLGPVVDVKFNADCMESSPCQHSKMIIIFEKQRHEFKESVVLFAKVLRALGAKVPKHFASYVNSKWGNYD